MRSTPAIVTGPTTNATVITIGIMATATLVTVITTATTIAIPTVIITVVITLVLAGITGINPTPRRSRVAGERGILFPPVLACLIATHPHHPHGVPL